MHSDKSDENADLQLLNPVGEVADVVEMVFTVVKNKFISGAIINVDGRMAADIM